MNVHLPSSSSEGSPMDRKLNRREKVTLDDLAREILSSELQQACDKVNLQCPRIYMRVTGGCRIHMEMTPLDYPEDKPNDPTEGNRN